MRIRDLLGREVVLPQPPRRIALGQGRLLVLMGLVHPDPASLLCGWASDMTVVLPDEHAAWLSRFPALRQVPLLGRRMMDDIALETIVGLQPDLLLLSRQGAMANAQGQSAVLSRFAELGIPVVVIDCMEAPLRDTLPSIDILGRLLGRETQAEALAAFYRARMSALSDWFAAHRPRTTSVLLHNHGGGRECCYSIAYSSFADLIAQVGGRSIAADVMRQRLGQLPLEWVLTHPADVYVTTGGVYNGRGGVSLGSGVEPALAARSLREMLERQGLDQLPSVQAGRAFGIWHGFNETPQHLVALEALARWLHPETGELFDPRRTLEAFNTRFAAVPMEGCYWTTLPA